MSIKIALKKLEIRAQFETIFDDITENGFKILPITWKHILCNKELPLNEHRDPFDRLIVSQTITENMVLVSKDEYLDQYFDLGPVSFSHDSIIDEATGEIHDFEPPFIPYRFWPRGM